MASFQEDFAERIYTNPKFKQDFSNLLNSQFYGYSQNGHEPYTLEKSGIKRLVESALIMASSPNEEHKRVAFELATIFYESDLSEQFDFDGVMKLICTRLGNFPGVNLISEETVFLPPSLNVESEAYITENTINIEEQSLKLTKFQIDSFRLMSEGYSVSLSAPTSAGKSFLMTQFIASRFLREENYSVVAIVPTRALIRQMTRDFHSLFSEYHLGINGNNGDGIEFVTSSVEYLDRTPAKKRLFILTQERLQAILYNWKVVPKFDLLVVDESQKIGDTKRGIILEDTITELSNIQSNIQCIFLSPLSSNPNFLFELLQIPSQSRSIYSSISPVAQHVYSVSLKKGNRRRIFISKIGSGLGEYTFEIKTKESMPNSKAKRIAFVAKLLGNNSNSILYANGPVEAERIALELAKNDDLSAPEASDVTETVDYLSSIIHEDYHLVKCLEKGIGYHYGAMPDIAKISVEDLFRNEFIPYVACTSTLLEGVNLPAKNVFIEDPKLGHIPMDDSSFWNLAGRAGRLMKDFSGNVYCIFQERWDKPVADRRKRYRIQSSLTKTLNDDHFSQYCLKLSPQIDTDSFEQAANNLVLKYKEKGVQATEAFIESRVPQETKDLLVLGIETLADSITMPLPILKKNKSIDFRLQQNFVAALEELRSAQLLDLIPRHPFSPDSYDVLNTIFSICDNYLILADRGKRYRYFTVIANQWIREESLRDMIRSSVRYNETREPDTDVNKIIRDLVNALNNELRFYYVRNTKCFCDLLEYELNRRNLSIEDYPPYADFGLPNYLELGMSNIGTIQLHNLGLSRTTSIEVNNFCRNRGVEPEGVVNWVRERADSIARQLVRPLRVELLRVFS